MKSESENSHLDDILFLPFSADKKHKSMLNALHLYFLLILSSSVTLLILCCLTKRYPLHHQRVRNSVSRSFLLSFMLQSWIWFVYLYSYQFRGLSLFKDFLYSRNAVISTAFMPFVDIGYYAFGIMGVFYLVEFPFLLWYISTKVIDLDRRDLNRRQCMLYMLKSVGYAGMVLFMQVASWYLVYILIAFLAYPLLALEVLAACLIMFILITAVTALLLLPCLTRCRRCPQQSGPIVFLIMIALLCGGFLTLLMHALANKWSTSFNASQIVSGIFASGMLALLTYTFNSVLTQYTLKNDAQESTDFIEGTDLQEGIDSQEDTGSQAGTDESGEQMLQPV